MDNILYENLANAIVAQAAKDYIKALKCLKKYPQNVDALCQIREIKRFFHSSWYRMLTEADGDYIIAQLEQVVVS